MLMCVTYIVMCMISLRPITKYKTKVKLYPLLLICEAPKAKYQYKQHYVKHYLKNIRILCYLQMITVNLCSNSFLKLFVFYHTLLQCFKDDKPYI